MNSKTKDKQRVTQGSPTSSWGYRKFHFKSVKPQDQCINHFTSQDDVLGFSSWCFFSASYGTKLGVFQQAMFDYRRIYIYIYINTWHLIGEMFTLNRHLGWVQQRLWLQHLSWDPPGFIFLGVSPVIVAWKGYSKRNIFCWLNKIQVLNSFG